MQFGWAVLISIILNFIVLCSLVGAFLIIYYLLSMVGIGDVPILISIIGGVLLVLYLVMMNGLKGALINTLKNITKREKPSITYFFKYALYRGEVFFAITVLKYVVAAIPLVPIYLLYQYVLLPMEVPYIDWIFGIVVGAILFLVEVPFVYAYVAAATNDFGIIKSLKSSLRLLRKKSFSAFGVYTLYALIWVTLYIPLLNIITVFALYPMMYTAIILFYEKYK